MMVFESLFSGQEMTTKPANVKSFSTSPRFKFLTCGWTKMKITSLQAMVIYLSYIIFAVVLRVEEPHTKHSAAWSCLCATNEVAGRHYYSEMSTKQQVQRENRVQKVRFFKELQRSKLSILFHSLQMNAGTQFSYSHLIPGSTIPQAIAVLEPSSAVTSDNRQTFEQQHLLNNNTTCLCVLQSPRARKIVVLPQTGVTHASDTTYLLG